MVMKTIVKFWKFCVDILIFLRNICIFVIALVLFVPISIINFFVVSYKFYKKDSRAPLHYFLYLARSVDVFGNIEFKTLFNCWAITPQSEHHFGGKETLSSVFGKNKKAQTLSKFGKIIVSLLDFIDKNHCEKAIEENVHYKDKNFDFLRNK